jgi:MFS transporter, PAT family, beta-lactamase induction signal transducer AmpG
MLSALYFVQGLPFGFQASALGAYLRQDGASRTAIGFLSALSAPWLLKALWAPLVDRYGSVRFGRRKSWIVPLQGLLAVTCFAASAMDFKTQLPMLLALVFLMNLFAATMDIAVDGLAVDILRAEDLGLGNSAQVVGYKIGMLVGGGLLVWLTADLGRAALFWVMGGLCLAVMVATFFFPEVSRAAEGAVKENPTFAEVWQRVKVAVKSPGSGWLILAMLTYKLGEALADKMYTPFLIDRGNTPADVGLWLGTWGMLASLFGSTVGGIIATRRGLLESVLWTGGVRAFPIALQWAQTAGLLPVNAATVIAVNCTEHFFAGALTTCMFALMMSRVDRRIGGTHYTVLASIEVGGKAVTALSSGVLADKFGYPPVFLGAALVTMAFPLLAVPLKRSLKPLPLVAVTN